MDSSEPETVEQTRAFYREITDPVAKQILDFLIDHPDERFDGAALVEQLGLSAHREVALSTYRMGRIAVAQGLQRPWREGQLGYLMPRAQATLLREARAQLAAS